MDIAARQRRARKRRGNAVGTDDNVAFEQHDPVGQPFLQEGPGHLRAALDQQARSPLGRKIIEQFVKRDAAGMLLAGKKAHAGALEHLGETVTVFSSISDPRLDKKPYLIPLSHRRNKDFLIVAFTDEELEKLELEKWKGKLVHVRGKVSQYRGRAQMKAADVEKIWEE